MPDYHRTMIKDLPLKHLLLCFTVLSSFGCSLFESEPEEPVGEATELTPSTVKNAETPEEILFERAKLYYQGGSYSLALDSFSSLRDGYPGGAYTEFAEIKIADCHFLSKQYEESSKHYEDIIKNRPASTSTPYLLFQLGRSYQLLNQGVGRDRDPLEKAITYFDRLISDYPDSVYTQPAKHYRSIVFKTLAKHEQEVLDFYKDRGAKEAYEARKKEFDKNWSEHLESTTPEIVTPKREVLKGVPREAIVERDVTVTKQSQLPEASPSVKDIATPEDKASDTLENKNAELSSFTALKASPTPNSDSSTANPPVVDDEQVSDQARSDEPQVPATKYEIRDIRCDSREGKKVIIHLNRTFEDETFLIRNQFLIPKNNAVTVDFPFTFERDITVHCFDRNDLTISSRGHVSIKTESQASLLSVDNPPRILIFLDQ